MERELWSELSAAVAAVAATWKESRRFTHPTARVVAVHLWAVLHDRSDTWACVPENWDERVRPDPEDLPDQSTLSRRKRTELFWDFMEAVGARLAGRPAAAALVRLKRLDGKPLPVAAHSKDPDARWGRGAGQQSKGYKLHAIWSDRPMPDDWAVTPLDVDERLMARRMLKRMGRAPEAVRGRGYLLADALYDGSGLHDLSAAAGYQLLAPRRRPGAGLGHRYQSRHRLRCLELLEPPAGLNAFGTSLHGNNRPQAERDFGNLTGFGGGLGPLPAWVRRPWRVRAWVYGKLLVNAARIRRLRRRKRSVHA